MNKKLILSSVFCFILPLFAHAEMTPITPACKAKIEKFAAVFAEANLMYIGQDITQKITSVKVESEAQLEGESGFATVQGSYDLQATSEDEVQTINIPFSVLYVGGPHCSIQRIQVSDLL